MKQIFVISDLHIGCKNDLSIFRAGDALTRFVRHLTELPNACLVILGDAVDYLQMEPYLDFTPAVALKKTTDILDAHPDLFEALGAFARIHQLQWAVGNHDVELLFPGVRDAIEAKMQAAGRIEWHLKAGAIEHSLNPQANARLVHGNEGDSWNHIDFDAAHAAVESGSAWAYPPGSVLVAKVINPLKKQGHVHLDLLKPEKTVALPLSVALWPESAGALIFNALGAAGSTARAALRKRWRQKGEPITMGAAEPGAEGASEPTLEDLLSEALGGLYSDGNADLREWLFDATAYELESDALTADAGGEATMGGSMRAIRQALIKRAVHAITRGTRTFDLSDPDDMDRDVQHTFGQPGLNAAVIIAGHSHLARAVDYPGGWYFNTGTWADLMHIPPGLDGQEFRAGLSDLRAALDGSQTAYGWLRPFRRLTYVEIQTGLDTVAGWTARLMQWPEEEGLVLRSAP